VLIEERAIALLYDHGKQEYYAASFWRDGRILHSIHASSFDRVLDFEKQNF
jgi:hypothetical protein